MSAKDWLGIIYCFAVINLIAFWIEKKHSMPLPYSTYLVMTTPSHSCLLTSLIVRASKGTPLAMMILVKCIHDNEFVLISFDSKRMF